MADTYSTRLKTLLMQSGTHSTAWGSDHNSGVTQLLDDAIAGRSTVSLSGTTSALAAMSPGASSTSRSMFIRYTGSPSGAVTVTVDASITDKVYIIDNQCGQSIVFTYGSGGTVTVLTGTKRIIGCNGTDCFAVTADAADSSSLGGVAAANYARRDQENSFAKRNRSPWITVTDGPTVTVDSSLGNNFIVTLSGNRTMAAPTNVGDGHQALLAVVQDGSGARTLTWNSVFLFENGIAPTLGTAPGAVDLFLMVYNSTLNKWLVSHYSNITASGGAAYTFTINENTTDWNLLAKTGSLGSAATINITVAKGVVIQALSTSVPAMNLAGMPSGSTINLVNLGYILGKGGNGANGAGAGIFRDSPNPAGAAIYSSYGKNGGPAMVGPGTGISFNITNGAGSIWGGGGGGGGGGAKAAVDVGGSNAVGGAGGGGAGGGLGGMPTPLGIAVTSANNAANGSTGPTGTYGAGSSGVTSGSGSGAGVGGDGGTWGAAGATGTFPGSGATYNGANSDGGTAGKAIELNGGSTPTWISGSGSPNVKGGVS